jgi:hypothetical protein
VLDILASPAADNPTDAYFEAASAAEAHLVLGHLDRLQESLQRAAQLRGDDWQLGSDIQHWRCHGHDTWVIDSCTPMSAARPTARSASRRSWARYRCAT